MTTEKTQPETKKCPYCAEEIKYNAIYCRYCQKDLPSSLKSVPHYVPKSDANKKKKAESATIPFILSILSLLTWIYPLLGFPVALTALVWGLKKSELKSQPLATAAIIISSFGLLATVANSAAGAYYGARGELITYPANTPRPPRPTSTYRPAPTATHRVNSMRNFQTQVALRNKPDDCISWEQVTAAHIGQELCVYGYVLRNVYVAGTTNQIRFSDDPNKFFLASGTYYYPDVGRDDCVVAQGPVLSNTYGVPYIDIDDGLKHCN